MPFRNDYDRDIHFEKHGQQFGASDALDYERMADAFMHGAIEVDARACTRPNGVDRVRFGFSTRKEGVACIQPDFLRTFYRVSLGVIRRRGGNSKYFCHECGRMNP